MTSSQSLLTKDDKIELLEKINGSKVELINKMDTHFKAMVAIMLTAIALAVTILELH